MAWMAHSTFRGISRGVVLTLTYTPHVVGYASPPLAEGDIIEIEFAMGARGNAIIIELSAGQMVLEFGESRWIATPRKAEEPVPPGIDTGSIPSEDWIIRSRVPQSN